MKSPHVVLVLIAFMVAAAPAGAQPPGASWPGDVCQAQKVAAAHRGTFLGAILGGLFGALVGGRGNRASGAAVGGTAGAVAGHAAVASSVQCLPYPPRVEAHAPNCHWASEAYDGAAHEFEVCRDPDGVWRPSGRS